MSIPLYTYDTVSLERIEQIKNSFINDWNTKSKHYSLTSSEYNTGLYLYVIKNHIPWVTARRLSDRKIEVWVKDPKVDKSYV